MASTGLPPNTTGTGQMKEKIPSGYSKNSIKQFDDNQMNLYNQLFGHLGPDSYLSKLASGDQSTFGEIEAPALKQFSALQGQMGSRFSGMGTGGQKSSGFQNSMNSAAQDFAGQLQSQRQGLQSQALRDLMGFSNQILGQRPYQNVLTQKEESPWARIIGQFAGAVPGAVAGYAKGGWGGAAQGASGGLDVAKSIPGV